VILAARNHPLAGKGVITTSDLNHARWALHQPGTGIRDAADALLRQLGVTDNIQANALPSNMILSLLRMGDHLAIVPRYVMANNIAAADLVQIVTNTPPVELAHAAIWHDRAGADTVTRRLVRHLQQSLAPLHNA
jgi:DNA-binding transcriptional LysR family regulator